MSKRFAIIFALLSLLTISFTYALNKHTRTPLSDLVGGWTGKLTLERKHGELRYVVRAFIKPRSMVAYFHGKTSNGDDFSFNVLMSLYSYDKNKVVMVVDNRERLRVEKFREQYDIPFFSSLITFHLKHDKETGHLFLSFSHEAGEAANFVMYRTSL